MMQIEGRVLAGLDEFMLRTGHLAVICRVAHEAGGSWGRVQRELVERLASTVTVSESENEDVARYLASKKLCRVSGVESSEAESEGYRYPDLLVVRDNERLRVSKNNGDIPEVGWQDRNLANPLVRSRVGAITWSAKSGSKTGLSHLWDWAQYLDLIDSSGQVSPIGRLLIAFPDRSYVSFEAWNPYVLGAERLVFAHQYLRKDVDLFALLAPRLLSSPTTLTKSVCRAAFVDALEECVALAESSSAISPRERFELVQQWRDLERSASRSGKEVDKMSTAWHRAASRVEVLTDIGLLEKGKKDEGEKYQYVYHPTDRLKLAVEKLAQVQSGDDWIDENLVDLVLSPAVAEDAGAVESTELMKDLKAVIEGVKLPTTNYPIDCLALGVSMLAAKRGIYPSIKVLRRAIEEMPVNYPDVARLSRGREGVRAEFVSINVSELAKV